MEVASLKRGTTDKGVHEVSDKYTASIELSNACRHFYNTRMEAAAGMKVQIQERITAKNENSPSTRKRWGINEAMDKLREEMVCLMDQDLTLMKQLLNLNETIEDLKWQRSNYYSGSSSDESDISVSETEMYADSSDNDIPPTRTGRPTSTSISRKLLEGLPKTLSGTFKSSNQQKTYKRMPQIICPDQSSSEQVSDTNLDKSRTEYRSFDSGINESEHIEIRV